MILQKQGGNRVLLVGDVMLDILVKPHGDLRTGSDRKADIDLKSGGSAANQAVWLAANSVLTRLVARVGAHDIASLTRQFEAKGVMPSFIADPNRSTGVLVSMISPDGERSFYTDRGANEALCIDDLPDDLWHDVSVVLLSGYSFFVDAPRAVAQELMAQAKEKNIEVMIDPSSAGFIKDVGVANFLDWTRGASILFPNAEEAALLSGESERRAQLAFLGHYYGQVILTEGALGASAIGEDGALVHVCAAQVDVMDTTGAGDAFVGGFLAARNAGESLETCLEKGVAQGAKAVGQMGAQPV